MKNLKYILYVVCGLLAFAPALTSCQDKPMEDPAEEIFLREFIKKYGLIDPNQDWNQAERTSVTVNVDKAKEINVYVKYYDHYYRVACFIDVVGEVTIPVDVPESTDLLYVSVDGKVYTTTLGGYINTVPTIHKIASRAASGPAPYGRCMKITTGEGTNDWDNQFKINVSNLDGTGTFSIQDGDILSVSFELRKDANVTKEKFGRLSLNNSSGYIYNLGTWQTDDVPVTSDWSLYRKEETYDSNNAPNEDRKGQSTTSINLDLGSSAGDTFYFDNITVYVARTVGSNTYNYGLVVNFSNPSDYSGVIDTNLASGGSVLYDYEPNESGYSYDSNNQNTYTSGIVSQLWWLNGAGGKTFLDSFNDDNKIQNVNFSQYFYQPNPSENSDYYSATRRLGFTMHVTSPIATQMVMNDLNPYAYANVCTAQKSGYLKISFDASVSNGGVAYFYPDDSSFGSSPGGLINESKRYEFITNSSLPQNKYVLLAFKALAGNVTISNMSLELFETDPNQQAVDPDIQNAGDLTWLMVAEDLGATDDFDFNDVIIQVKALTTNTANLTIKNEQWQVIQDDQTHLVLHSPSKSPSREMVYTNLYIKALCAGGILDSYLHFSTGAKDYVLKSGKYNFSDEATDAEVAAANSILTSEVTKNNNSNPEEFEWHSWFEGGPYGTTANQREMLNTGYSLAGDPTSLIEGKACIITVNGDFSITQYSRIFKDYDGVIDDINTDDFGYQNEDPNKITQLDNWHYAKDGGYIIHGFYISVGNADHQVAEYLIGQPKKGRAPQMFLIPDMGHTTDLSDQNNGLWRWPHERVDITDVYPKFKAWVNSNTEPNWYRDTPTAEAQTKEGKKAGPGVEVVKAYVDRNNY